jgi:outer membrane protein assembly factor BamE
MLQRVLLMCMTLALASCFSTPLSPHKIDVQQGNYVDQEMVAKLKPGMTKSQVRFVLGTPLVADPFHANRWDYVFRMQKNGSPPEHRKMTVVFEDDKLARVDGDVVPGNVAEDEKPKVTKVAPKPLPGAAGPVKKTAEEKSLKEKIEALIAEKEAEGKDESELRKSLAKLLGVEERQSASSLPRAKTVDGKEKAPPAAQQAKSDLSKAKPAKVAKAKSEEKSDSTDSRLRASGLSADILSALGVRYEGDGKPDEEEAVAQDDEEGATDEEGAKPAKRKTARKSGLKADGLSADILRTLGIPFEGDGSENAVEEDEGAVAEGEEKPNQQEKGGVLDELKNAEGKSVKQQLAEKFSMGDEEDKPAKKPETEEMEEDEEPGQPTFMDDVRTVLGLGSSGKTTRSKDEKPAKGSDKAKDDADEEDAEVEDEEEVPEKPTFWDDVKTVLGID